MEYNGLNDERALIIANRLATGELGREKSEKQSGRRLYTSVLEEITSEFNTALKDKNFIMLFDLEKVCQKHDKEYLNVSKDKTIKSYVGIDQLKQIYIDALDPEKVRSNYSRILGELKEQGSRVQDSVFETSIRSQTRVLGNYMSPRLSFAEKNFYETRQKCLLALKQEHQRNLDRAMGYEKKSHSKEKDQEISR